MKTLAYSLLLLTVIVLSSCIEEQRIVDENDSSIASVFEIKDDFTSQNDYTLYFDFPSNFKVYTSDVVMVYLLWEQTTIDGKKQDVWRPLPQTIVLNSGVLQYNFDYTTKDVKIFLDGTVDFSTLLPAEKNDQVFRIVVFPAVFANSPSFDKNNLEGMMNLMQLDQTSVQKIGF
jgi:hypothetical protein